MKQQPKPSAASKSPSKTEEGKKGESPLDQALARARHDMKVEVRSAIVALGVGIVIFEISLITVLMNLTGWTLFWVGFPGLVVSALLLFVVYILFKHKKDLETLADLLAQSTAHGKS
jgi:ABC-type bacteriocin/lantibiotic exporter with double-glycine peptidase domain